MQKQGVIAEYERAKIAERYRRGKLYRARQGEIPFWKTSYAHRRVASADGGPARIEVFEREAEIVRWIFDAYVEKGRSVRQISFDLLERGIPSPAGKPMASAASLPACWACSMSAGVSRVGEACSSHSAVCS